MQLARTLIGRTYIADVKQSEVVTSIAIKPFDSWVQNARSQFPIIRFEAVNDMTILHRYSRKVSAPTT